jgi:hypothetical protein
LAETARRLCGGSHVVGRLALAKFPKPDDIRDIAGGEILALTLAADAGIRVAEHRLAPVGKHSVAAYASAFDHELMDEARRLLAK